MNFFRSTIILVLLSSLFFTSCSNIKMSYQAKVKTTDQKDYNYTFEKSYKVGGWQVMCIITGIFYGGACWGYLGMPTSGQRKKIGKDAKETLDQKLGAGTYVMADVSIKRRSWKRVDPSYTLAPFEGGPVTIKKTNVRKKS